MTEKQPDKPHDQPARNDHTEDGINRRDLMKVAGGAIVADTSLTGVGAAQTTFCGRDDCSAVVKPPKDVYVVTDDRSCVAFNHEYLDAKLDEGFDTLGIKSGSCTNHSDGNKACDYVGLENGIYSYCVPDTCNDISHPELVACDDCTYEDDAYAIETAEATCESIPVCVQSTDANCPVTAVLHVAGEDCAESTLAHEFTTSGRHTFELSGCCTPQKVMFTDGHDTFATVDVPFVNCGYEDLAVGNVRFCCDSVSFNLENVECDLTATLTLAHDDCQEQLITTLTDDGPVKFSWTDCLTPKSVTLTRDDGETVATLSPSDPLTCTCDEEARTTCTFSGEKLPVKDETMQFECHGVTFDVTTTAVVDGTPACFRISNPSDRVLRVDVKGTGTTTYSFGDCGTFWAGDLCAHAAGADEPTAIESWTLHVCTEDVGGCVDGTTTTEIGDHDVTWDTGDVASSCADLDTETDGKDDEDGDEDDDDGGGG